MSSLLDWPDVWSEYRKFFACFGITDERVAAAVCLLVAKRMPRPDIDRVAEALKEFAVRAWERGVPDDGVALELARVKLSIEPSIAGMTRSVTLFGTPAEDLGIEALRLLAELVAPRERERY